MRSKRSGSWKTDGGKAWGFTLVELLVVIGILGLLAAIILPAFASTRRKAQQMACVGNLHQLSLACSLYSQDNTGLLPPYPSRATEVTGVSVPTCVEQSSLLLAALHPYVHSTGVWRCPSDEYHPVAGTTSCGLPFSDLTSYRYQGYRHVPGGLAPLPIDYTTVRVSPSTYPLLEDDWVCEQDSDFYHQYNHGGRWNHIFLDGHARSFGIDCSNSPMISETP